jgi:hypothetical protein
MAFCRERVAPYKRIRRLEFGDLPKTISGKIRRVELRGQEESRSDAPRGVTEFWEEDFTWLRVVPTERADGLRPGQLVTSAEVNLAQAKEPKITA